MNTKTVFSIQYNGNRYQVREIRYSINYVRYDILQNRRVINSSRFLTKRSAILELLQLVGRNVIKWLP